MTYDRAAIMRDAHKRFRDGKRLGLGWTFGQCLATAWSGCERSAQGSCPGICGVGFEPYIIPSAGIRRRRQERPDRGCNGGAFCVWVICRRFQMRQGLFGVFVATSACFCLPSVDRGIQMGDSFLRMGVVFSAFPPLRRA